jgi:hypothetical protein
MKKVISKGYTLTVTSWENDGDNYRTKSMVFESEDEAKAIAKMCKAVFNSCNNGDGGIGNMMDYEGEMASEVILEYLEENPEIKETIIACNPKVKLNGDKDIFNFIMEKYNYGLMGGSECYYSRVCEKVDLTYSDKDILSQEVNF